MSIVIVANMYRDSVKRDLARLVPASDWSMDPYGFVDVVPTPTTVAGQLIAELASVGLVKIIGSEGAMNVPSGGNIVALRDNAGHTYFDIMKQGPEAEVVIVYDTTDNYRVGYWVMGVNNTKIDYPLHISLGHELAHAKQVLDGRYTTNADAEVNAVDVENLLRRADTPPLPQRVGHDGGTKEKPKETPKTPPPKTGGCFVATAAYGSPLHPAVCELREFRDDVLRRTRAGRGFFARFFDVYAQASEPVVDAMAVDPAVRDLVCRCLVTPIVRYLEIARDFPDMPLESAGPWAPFLAEVRDALEDFASVVPLPDELTSLPPREAGAELAVVLRYVMRRPARRKAWLADLRALGQLPLIPTDAEEATAIARLLRDSGRGDDEIALVLDATPPVGAPESVASVAGFGRDVDTTSVDRTQWIYTVTIRNATPGQTLSNIRAYYLAKPGTPDMMGLTVVDHMAPEEVAVFPLCVCSELFSYFIEADFTDTVGSGTIVLPAKGSIAADPNKCEDSWPF